MNDDAGLFFSTAADDFLMCFSFCFAHQHTYLAF